MRHRDSGRSESLERATRLRTAEHKKAPGTLSF